MCRLIFIYFLLQVTEQALTDNATVMKISEHFASFIKTVNNLQTFCPGLFITDRSQSNGDSEPHKLSLCYRCYYINIFGKSQQSPGITGNSKISIFNGG